MKTFKDLKFHKHQVVPNAVAAGMTFENGEHISVVGGDEFLHGDGLISFEVLTTLSEDVEGWQSEEQVTAIMIKVQSKKTEFTNQ